MGRDVSVGTKFGLSPWRSWQGLLDVPGDWLARLGLVVTVGPLSWLGYIERSLGAVSAFGRYNEHFSLGPVISP